jgi:hypothetical protein
MKEEHFDGDTVRSRRHLGTALWFSGHRALGPSEEEVEVGGLTLALGPQVSISVGSGPGMLGSLLMSVKYAREMARALNLAADDVEHHSSQQEK